MRHDRLSILQWGESRPFDLPTGVSQTSAGSLALRLSGDCYRSRATGSLLDGNSPQRRNFRPQSWHRTQTMNQGSGKTSRALALLLFLTFTDLHVGQYMASLSFPRGTEAMTVLREEWWAVNAARIAQLGDTARYRLIYRTAVGDVPALVRIFRMFCRCLRPAVADRLRRRPGRPATATKNRKAAASLRFEETGVRLRRCRRRKSLFAAMATM
jgi:hypothetical protein